MTSVYSGGLMYEYTLEANGYGIVKIPSAKSSVVEELDGFTKFANALAANPAPLGDGGFTSTTNSVPCPTKKWDWLVDTTLLPAIPENAKSVSIPGILAESSAISCSCMLQFMIDGAGPGPGLKGEGSQNAADGTSTGDAPPGSGAVTATPSSSENAAAGNISARTARNVEMAPIFIGVLVLIMSLSGTLLL